MDCTEPACTRVAVVYVIDARQRVCMGEYYLCDTHAEQYIQRLLGARPLGSARGHILPGAVEVDIVLIAGRLDANEAAIRLREIDGTREVFIPTGPWEAAGVTQSLKYKTPPRPLTHQTMHNLILALDAELEHVIIQDLAEVAGSPALLANLCIVHAERTLELDVRPSDAVALALCADVPIYVNERLFSTEPQQRVPPGHPAGAGEPGRQDSLNAETRGNARSPEGPPQEEGDRRDVFFSGHHDCGSSLDLKIALGAMALALVAALAAVLGFLWPERIGGLALTAAFIAALLGIVGIGTLQRWRKGQVEYIELSAQGVTADEGHWPWSDVESVRILPHKPWTGPTMIKIAIHNARTGTRKLVCALVDRPLSMEEKEHLLARVTALLRS